MRLQIVHRTTYEYSSPVSESFNETRLQPVSTLAQDCHEFELRLMPATRISHYRDFYRNLVHHFDVVEPHSSLLIEGISTVTTGPNPFNADVIRFPRSRLHECQRMDRCIEFLQPSGFVSGEVEVWRLAQDVVAGIEDAWQASLAIMRFIHSTFSYDPRATTVATPMLEALQKRRGVCQDFAHVMLGLCRAAGIPARYVSGYLYVDPSADLRGAQASHAWVEVFVPDHGWLGLDPTNNCLVDRHHVKVAVGRDYGDAAPIRGSFRGAARQTMDVQLHITRLDDGVVPRENRNPVESGQAGP